MLHLAMVRSPLRPRHASPRIDTAAAKAAPGVVAVLTGADLADEQGGAADAPGRSPPDMVTPRHPALAVDHVAFAGEAVAVVVARTPREARDAADLVDVDYDDAARRARHGAGRVEDGADLVHPDLGTNTSAPPGSSTPPRPAPAATSRRPSPQARADGVVIERRFRQQRLIPAFMEPRSIVVDPTGEQITMWSATQVPHILRVMLALVTGVPRPRSGSSRPTSAAASAASCSSRPRSW